MPIKDKVMLAKFFAAGWVEKRITGSHHVLQKGNKTVVIPVHGEDLKKGLEIALLKVLKET